MNDEKNVHNVHTEEKSGERDMRDLGKADICISCGAPVPEGRQVCPKCEEIMDAARARDAENDVDIFSFLPAEAVAAINRHGFEFLAGRGYDALGAWDDEAKCAALERELSERGEEIQFSSAYDLGEKSGEPVKILVWYGLYDREGRCIARSNGIKFVLAEPNAEVESAGGSDGAKDT